MITEENTRDSVRHIMPATETMLKYQGEIDRHIYSARIYCGNFSTVCNDKIRDCPFRQDGDCNLALLSVVIRSDVIQHDI